MKKFFKYIGLLTLICVSFIYTEKTLNVAKVMDEIMIKIKEEAPNFSKESVDAVVKGNTIIPGISGRVVDENKSYIKMKELGRYNPSLIEYKKITPKISITKNHDKYVIGGNYTKKQVSLILISDEDDDLKPVLNFLKEKDERVSVFVNSSWLEKNNDLVMKIINSGHSIGNLSYNGDYSHSDFVWMDTIFKRVGGQNNGYCLSLEENEEYLKTCALHKNYTIKPVLLNSTNPLAKLKENIKNGALIAVEINNETIKNLPLIIKYINSKGYELVNLDDIITE